MLWFVNGLRNEMIALIDHLIDHLIDLFVDGFYLDVHFIVYR